MILRGLPRGSSFEKSKGQPHKREAALILRCSLPPLMMALSWAVLYDLAVLFVNRKRIGAGMALVGEERKI
jgi:hypothetical protein